MTSLQIIIFHIFLCSTLASRFYSNTRYFDRRQYERNSVQSMKKPSEASKVKLSVFYETLCPASVDFFTSQLGPAIEELGSYIDVHLIPYGHARTKQIDRRYRFSCQHGPAECYGNKLHACSIEVLQNNTKSALLNACLMQYSVYRDGVGYDYQGAISWCGYKLNIPIDGIRICVNSERGNHLLKRYGDKTHRLNPDYVPYVLLNDSDDNQDAATGRLMTKICHILKPTTPAACQYY